jgi:hypothetical protein
MINAANFAVGCQNELLDIIEQLKQEKAFLQNEL